MRYTLAIAAILTLAGCGMSPTDPTPTSPVADLCPNQGMECYHFAGKLTVGGSMVLVDGWNQDMPRTGYANNWRYVLSPEAAGPLVAFKGGREGWVGVSAEVGPDGRGWTFAEAYDRPGGTLLWRLEMHPTRDDIAAKFALVSGASEYRAQHFESVGSEIRISEPQPVRGGKP